MEDLLQSIYQERINDANTLGILVVEKKKLDSLITDDFDRILLIIVKEAEPEWCVKHYEFEADKTAAIHIVTNDLLMQWIHTSGYRKVIAWLVYGKIIFDCDGFVANLQEDLRTFPNDRRKLRKTVEFGKLITSFKRAKFLYKSSQYKDAYSHIFHSLHYLARLAVIEQGYYPEVTVWNQVKQIDLEVFKLYSELIESNEQINKRVQLMILAADHVISSRAKASAQHLLEILQSNENSWTYEELASDNRVAAYSPDLTAVITYLIEKDIIQTVMTETRATGIYRRTYQVSTVI